ncbi:MAG: N-acetylmuramoyl-L-alanine amidase, partial [Actinomycetota bacterium]|nr:N-acetylmuramoyl-L-alanine amidase [Actinomycetota bacterium]
MRAPSLLLSFALLPAVVVGGPVVSTSAPDPHPVAPVVQEVALTPSAITQAGTGPRTLLLTSEQATRPYSTLGVTWRPDPAVGDVVVQVRTRTEGQWSGWTALDADEPNVVSETADEASAALRAGTEPLYAGDSDGVQVRVDVLSGASPTDLVLALVDPGESAADAPVDPTLGSSTATAAAARPAIRTRAEWGADESIRRGSPSYNATIEAVTIHHTASSNDYSPADVPGIIRGFYAYHVRSLGWSDIGYNVLVDKFGTAWEGRAGGVDRPVIGAHAGGFNTDTAGVSMIGTYGTFEPPPALKETVAQVTAWKLGMYGRDPKGTVTLTSRGSTRYSSGTRVTLPRIFGHRDVSSTACPGDRGYANLPPLRDRAAALNAGTPAPAPAPPPAPAPKPSPDPFGKLESAVPSSASVRVQGWAIDPDASTFTTVVVTADGTRIGAAVAKDSRPDVAAAHPPYSPNHGYAASFAVPSGRREVCVTAIDQNEGNDVQL